MTAPYEPPSRKESWKEWIWRKLFVRSSRVEWSDTWARVVAEHIISATEKSGL